MSSTALKAAISRRCPARLQRPQSPDKLSLVRRQGSVRGGSKGLLLISWRWGTLSKVRQARGQLSKSWSGTAGCICTVSWVSWSTSSLGTPNSSTEDVPASRPTKSSLQRGTKHHPKKTAVEQRCSALACRTASRNGTVSKLSGASSLEGLVLAFAALDLDFGAGCARFGMALSWQPVRRGVLRSRHVYGRTSLRSP